MATAGPLDHLASRELRRIGELRIDFAHLGEVADYLDELSSIVKKAAAQAAETNRPLFVGSGHGFALGDPAMAAAAHLRSRLTPKPAAAQRNLLAIAARLRVLSELVDRVKKDYQDQSERENAMARLLQTADPVAVPGLPSPASPTTPMGP